MVCVGEPVESTAAHRTILAPLPVDCSWKRKTETGYSFAICVFVCSMLFGVPPAGSSIENAVDVDALFHRPLRSCHLSYFTSTFVLRDANQHRLFGMRLRLVKTLHVAELVLGFAMG